MLQARKPEGTNRWTTRGKVTTPLVVEEWKRLSEHPDREFAEYILPDKWRLIVDLSHPAGVNITVKELLPIVVGVALWGDKWKVKCLCDKHLVAIINTGRGRDDPHAMPFLFPGPSQCDPGGRAYPRGGKWGSGRPVS